MNDKRSLNYRKIDFDALLEFLHSVDWTVLSLLDDVDDMALLFRDTLVTWLNSNLPLAKKPASPSWSTPHLRVLK